ncbi:MAG: hypothetical protein IPM37_00480 [Hahellaceae bacterium]|nr:hypothetical protein [Hahellaceae bacterium]
MSLKVIGFGLMAITIVILTVSLIFLFIDEKIIIYSDNAPSPSNPSNNNGANSQTSVSKNTPNDAEKPALTLPSGQTVTRSPEAGEDRQYSDNVYIVRDKIAKNIPPEPEEFIAAYLEIYEDRPESFKRNVSRHFAEVLAPRDYCTDFRHKWAKPYINTVTNGSISVESELWSGTSPGIKAQLAQYFSRCTQSGNDVEIIDSDSGSPVARYNLGQGYQSLN